MATMAKQHGQRPPRAPDLLDGRVRQDGGQRRGAADARPPSSSTRFSASTMRASRRRPKPGGLHQGELAAALEDAAELRDGQADGAEQQAEGAEALERRKIGVLNGHEVGEPLAGVDGVEAEVFELRFEQRRQSSVGGGVGRRGG